MQTVDSSEGQNHVDIAFYDRYAHLIYAYICRKVSCREDAEDVMTEVFVAAMKNPQLAEFDPGQQIAWLQRVAHNKVVDRYRRKIHLTLLPLERAMDMLDGQLTPEQYVVQQETYQRLYTALAQLPTVQQQVVRLRYGNHLRFAEIAAILDKSEVTVRNILHARIPQTQELAESHRLACGSGDVAPARGQFSFCVQVYSEEQNKSISNTDYRDRRICYTYCHAAWLTTTGT